MTLNLLPMHDDHIDQEALNLRTLKALAIGDLLDAHADAFTDLSDAELHFWESVASADSLDEIDDLVCGICETLS